MPRTRLSQPHPPRSPDGNPPSDRTERPAGGRGSVAAPLLVVLLVAGSGCAGLAQALGVDAPVFSLAEGRESRIEVELPSFGAPRGSALVTIWARVENPNGFGFTLSTLRGDLFLEEREMAGVDLPLGLPLRARGDTVVPLRIRVPIPDLDQLGDLGRALLSGGAVGYALDGTVGVDAGDLGEPTFGPRRWLSGRLKVDLGGR